MNLLQLLGSAAAICGVMWLFARGSVESFLCGFGMAMGSSWLLFSFRDWIRAQRELQMRARLEVVLRDVRAGGSLEVRGTPSSLIPLAAFLLAMFLWLQYARAMSFWPGVLTLLAVPVLLLCWTRGARNLFPPVLVLDRDGFSTPKLGRVTWAQVDTIEVADQTPGFSRTSYSVVFGFVAGQRPRPVSSWTRRNLRGIEDEEEFVHLRNASEDPMLVFHLAHALDRDATYPLPDAEREPELVFDVHAALESIRRTAATRTSQGYRRAIRRDGRDPWGTRTPATQWWLICGIFSAMGIGAFAGFSEFFHSQAWWVPSLWISLVGGVALSVWWLNTLLRRIPSRSRLAVALILPPFVILFFFVLVGRVLPDVYTRMAGESFELVVPGSKQVMCGKRCRHVALVPIFGSDDKIRVYHAWQREYAALPSKGTYRVSGDSSWFGRHVDRVAPVDPEFH